MTVSYPTPLSHAEDVITTFTVDAKRKYLWGQEEHGGRLWRKPVLPMLYQEVLDLPIYLLTLMDQIGAVRSLLNEAMASGDLECVMRALNILNTGNLEGIAEEDR